MGPRGLTFTWWGCCGLCVRHKPTELAHSFLFCSCVCFCLYDPFNCISFHKFSRQLSAFSLCSSGFISALMLLWTIHLFTKVSLSPDIILWSWLGLKNQLTYSQKFPRCLPLKQFHPIFLCLTIVYFLSFHGRTSSASSFFVSFLRRPMVWCLKLLNISDLIQ